MNYLKHVIICLLCLHSAGTLAKKIPGSNAEPGSTNGSANNRTIAINLDDYQISRQDFDWLYQKHVPRQTHTKREFAEQLADNWLVYQHTLDNFPEALTMSPVDYKMDWYLERQLVSYCQHELTATNNKEYSKSAERFEKLNVMQLKRLVKNFKLQSKLGFELTPEQRVNLEQISVARFDENETGFSLAFAKDSQQLSLLALFDRLSVQDKQRLFDGDFDLLKREIGIWLAYREYCGQLAPERLITMKSLLESLHFRHQLLDHYAISLEQHGDNKTLDSYRLKVTDEAIGKYYQANKKNFKYLKSSRYSVYRFDSIEEANDFRLAFSSDAAEVDAKWIDKSSKLIADQMWLRNFAFSLPKDHLSNPIRSPEGHWFVVFVFDKKFDYYSAASETVKYQATNFLAKKYARQFFLNLLQQLRKDSKVDINV